MNSVQFYWSQALEILEKELSPISFKTWISNIKPVSFEDDIFILETQAPVFKETIDKKLAKNIQEALNQVFNRTIAVRVVVNTGNGLDTSIMDNKPSNNYLYKNSIIEKYTFDNFIVGGSNMMAHAAALAVAEAPAEAYNPLFIYGGVGLGKTHLMHAVANHILNENPDKKVYYITSEKFTNEIITAIREKTTNEFKEKYRQLDVLLIDDIQFISGKDRTEEEFFHTFNELWLNKKQIIISSDRPPQEIKTLTERLRSRLAGDLIVDVRFPDIETRIAILTKFAEQKNIELPMDVLSFIAYSITSNIRELEGALNKVVAYIRLTNRKISIELAQEALSDIIVNKQKTVIDVEYIKKVVAKYYNITIESINDKKRTQPLATQRFVAFYLCRKHLDESFVNIGKKFGGRDYTTIMNGCNKISSMIEAGDNILNDIIEIEKILGVYNQ